MMIPKNKTSIVFDNKFKSIIKEIQPQVKVIETNEIHVLLDYQNELREYISNKYPNLITNKFPDWFSVFIALSLKIDDYNSWEEVSNTFDNNNIFDTSLNFPEGLNYKCACSHICKSQNMFIVKNKETDVNILLGSTCIEKNEIVQNFKRIKHERKLKLKKIEKEKCAIWNNYSQIIKNHRKELNEPNQCQMCSINIKKPYIYCYNCRKNVFSKCDCGKSKRKTFNKCYDCFKGNAKPFHIVV